MKHAPTVEDWSRFNRAVLEAADAVGKQTPPPQPKRDLAERVPEPGDDRDTYGLIARQKWRKQA